MGTFTKTVSIDFVDPAKPLDSYDHQKSVRVYDEGPPIEMVNVINDPKLYKQTTVFPRNVVKEGNEASYWFYENHDPLYHYHPYDYPHNTFTCYQILPDGEHIPDLDTAADLYGRYYMWPWTHLEISDDIYIGGVWLTRDTDRGDNIKRQYVNGSSMLSALASVVGATEANYLGIAYIPCTDRLNT